MDNKPNKALLNSKKFAKIIKESGKSQEELAEEFNISDRYLRILKSTNKDISVSLAYDISRQTGLSIESMLTINDGGQAPADGKTDLEQQLQKRLAKSINLIHSIKNCLQNIYGLLSILDLKCEKQDIKLDTLEPIRQEASDISSLLAEYIGGNTAAKVQPYSLNQLIAEVAQSRMAQFAVRNVEIKLLLDDNLPEIMLSIQHIKQLIINCLNNSLAAISAGQQQAGKICVRTHFVENRDMLEIIIADNGGGLTDEQRINFFNPGCTTETNGSGIGSNISLAIVKQHGGEMSVSGRPEGGCCIRVELPVHSRRNFDTDDFYNEIADMLF